MSKLFNNKAADSFAFGEFDLKKPESFVIFAHHW